MKALGINEAEYKERYFPTAAEMEERMANVNSSMSTSCPTQGGEGGPPSSLSTGPNMRGENARVDDMMTRVTQGR